MSTLFVTSLLCAATLGNGLMAGIYFAFSGFIMRSLGSIDAPSSIAAMNSINSTILKSWFMPIFFGTTAIAVLLGGAGVMYWNEPGARLAFAAGTSYFFGMFGCTAAFNVPLNNALAAARVEHAGSTWSRYRQTWTRWNHLRTACSVTSCALCIYVLSAY